ncbi:uncharacterized protein [Nicotiana sylvestris]|uniref:uncharacterized protein n=1 Tax=Nicotiana sylvestris TaxID=4096 RepID=UPI00388C5327
MEVVTGFFGFNLLGGEERNAAAASAAAARHGLMEDRGVVVFGGGDDGVRGGGGFRRWLWRLDSGLETVTTEVVVYSGRRWLLGFAWCLDVVDDGVPTRKVADGFLLVLTNYFSKWVETSAYTRIREQEVITFIWKNIICRFGIPKEISCDNGPQFVGKRTIEFFEKWHIKRILSTPYHPAANSQAESSNKLIPNILKKKLEDAKGLWPELIPEVLWAYCIAPKTSTGETPYSLVYGTDAVIPIKVGYSSLRYSNESGPSNDESRLQDLDEVEERRDMAHIRMVAQKQQVERYYNKRAKVRPLKVGDYVLKAKTQASKDTNKGKLGTN